MNLACAAGIGAVSGLRSMAGPAIVSEAASRNIVRLRKTPMAWLASDRAARVSAVLAVGEMIADKLPFTPDRTGAPMLAVRAAAGALCGYAICGKGRSRSNGVAAALVGGLAALATSYAGLHYRKRLPSIAAALLEDAVAVGSGAAVIAAISK